MAKGEGGDRDFLDEEKKEESKKFSSCKKKTDQCFKGENRCRVN